MATSAIKLSKAEWRQVSNIAAAIDWTRHGRGVGGLEAGLGDRAATALQQLLRLM